MATSDSILNNVNMPIDSTTDDIFNQMEEKILLLKKENNQLTQQLQDAKQENSNSKSLIEQLQTETNNYQNQLSEFNSSGLSYNSQVKELQKQLRDIIQRDQKHQNEVDRLNSEIEKYSQKLLSLTSYNTEIEIKFHTSGCEINQLKIENNQIISEQKLSKKRIEFLEEQIEKSDNELLVFQRELSKKSFQNKSLLEKYSAEKELLIQENQNLKNRFSEQVEEIKTLSDENGKLSIEFHRDKEISRQELMTQTKLSELYQKSHQDNLERIDVLNNFINGFKKSISDKDNQINTLKNQLEQSQKECEEMKKQPPIVPLLTEQSNDIEPIQPPEEYSKTQIFSKYLETLELLQIEKDKNSQIMKELEQIEQEVENTAPILHQQRIQYETLLQSHKHLSNNLQKMKDLHIENQFQFDKLSSENTKLKNQCQCFLSENKDLAKQLRGVLAKSLGKHFKENDQEIEQIEKKIDQGLIDTKSSSIISEYLVTYSDITELQLRNKQLLSVVRDLSIQLDEKERKFQELSSQLPKEQDQRRLNQVLLELETMKDYRKRQENQFQNLLKQLNIFQDIIKQHGLSTETPLDVELTNISSSINMPATTMVNLDLEKKEEIIRTLQHELEVYNKEMIINQQMNQDRLIQVEKDASNSRIELAQTKAQLEFVEQRNSFLNKNIEVLQQDTELLRNKNLEISRQLNKTEKNLEDIMIEYNILRGNNERSKNQIETLQSQNTLLANSEKRFLEEQGKLREQQLRQEGLLQNLQNVQMVYQNKEIANYSRILKERDDALKELFSLKNQLELQTKTHWEASQIIKNEKQELSEQVDSLSSELQNSRDNTIRLNCHIENDAKKILELSEQLDNSQKRLDMLLSRKNISRDIDLSSSEFSQLSPEHQLSLDLEEKTKEIFTLNEKLVETQNLLNEFKKIALDNENAAKLLTESTITFKTKYEEEINNLNEKISSLHNRNTDLIETNLQSDKDYEILRLTMEKERNEHKNIINEAKENENRKEKEINILQEQCKQLNNDIEMQIQLTKDAENQYHLELQSHANDCLKLSTITQENNNNKILLRENQCQIEKYIPQINELKQEKIEIEEKEKKYHLENEQKNAELIHQNNLLLNQIDILSKQQEYFLTNSTSSSLDSDNIDQNNEYLEIIKFLRGEKDRFYLENERNSQDNLKLNHEIVLLKNEISSLKTSIEQNEKESIKSFIDDEALLEENLQLSLLRESNNHLREECHKSLERAQIAEKHIKELTDNQGPLEMKAKELESINETLKMEKETLNDTINKWKERNQQLLSKYKQIDPEVHQQLQNEYQNLKEKIVKLENDSVLLQKIQIELDNAKNEINNQNEQIQSSNTRYEKLQNAAKWFQSKMDFYKKQNDILLENKKQENISEISKENLIVRIKKMLNLLQNAKNLLIKRDSEIEENFETINNIKLQIEIYEKQISTFPKKEADIKKENDLKIVLISKQFETKIKNLNEDIENLEQKIKNNNTTLLTSKNQYELKIQQIENLKNDFEKQNLENLKKLQIMESQRKKLEDVLSPSITSPFESEKNNINEIEKNDKTISSVKDQVDLFSSSKRSIFQSITEEKEFDIKNEIEPIEDLQKKKMKVGNLIESEILDTVDNIRTDNIHDNKLVYDKIEEEIINNEYDVQSISPKLNLNGFEIPKFPDIPEWEEEYENK